MLPVSEIRLMRRLMRALALMSPSLFSHLANSFAPLYLQHGVNVCRSIQTGKGRKGRVLLPC